MQTLQSTDLSDQIIKYYRSQTSKKRSASISSPTRRITLLSKSKFQLNEAANRNPEQFQIFLKNQKHLSYESPGLEFKELPGNLKIHFDRPPSPPPKLQAVPYTFQIVPMQPVKAPKRKRGEMADWVFKEMGWQHEQAQQLRKKQMRKLQTRGSKSLARQKPGNPSIYQIVKREMKSKPYQHYNSIQFFKYVKEGNLEEVEFALKQTPSLAADFDDQKMTPLHWATRQGHADVVKLLTQKYKANVNAQDNYGRTPIYLASENRKNECIYRLFIEGANLTIPTTNRKTPKDVAPDLYTKYTLQKIQQIKRVLETRRVPENQFKQTLQSQIRATLDPSSAYF